MLLIRKTPLMYAITEKRTTMVKFLVEKGADISIKDNQEHKAIDYATANGLRDIIAILISDITETNITGDTPLYQACYNEQSEVVKELLKNENVPINSINDEGHTPLVIACIRENTLIANILLEANADPNIALLDGNTALHFASSWNNKYIAESLLKYNANINAQNENGQTALIIAAQKGYNDVVKLLLEKTLML